MKLTKDGQCFAGVATRKECKFDSGKYYKAERQPSNGMFYFGVRYVSFSFSNYNTGQGERGLPTIALTSVPWWLILSEKI